MKLIDLRSDTVTLPSKAMREVMSQAPVGDDQYGEDPSANRLQERVAEIFGKESALFVPSGTMANQIALKVFTHHGDDVIVGEQSHAVFHETGAAAANAGVQFTEVGRGGLFTADDFRAAYKQPGHIVYPPTTLVEVENTHNRSGGLIFPQDEARSICDIARSLSVATYLDGARIFNTAVATGLKLSELAAPFDMIGVSLSKGLGAPVGSVLAGTKADITKALRHRRILGGAMRQCGIIAAAGLFALEHNFDRLYEDHENARIIADKLAQCQTIDIDCATTRTNIVIFKLAPNAPSAFEVVETCRAQGVLLLAFAERVVRLVTHLDVDMQACQRAADIIVRVTERRL
jgi:threonine aldolase